MKKLLNEMEVNQVTGGLSPKDKRDWQEFYCEICKMYNNGTISGEQFDEITRFFDKKMDEPGCARD